jgi:hypothetical protein
MIRVLFPSMTSALLPLTTLCALLVFAGAAGLAAITQLASALGPAPQAWQAALLPDLNCGEAVVCPLNISAGDMSMPDALALLETSPWVQRIYFHRGMDMDSGYLYWDWSGAQPGYVDGGRRGSLWFSSGRVQWVEIGTTLRFGDVWAALDQPQNGRVRTSSAADGRLFQIATYYEGGLSTQIDLYCPLDAASFWRARVVLRSNGAAESRQLLQNEPDAYRLPERRICRGRDR